MTLKFGDLSVKIVDMFRQKHGDYYQYEVSYHGFITKNGVHVISRTKEELINKIVRKLEGENLF